MFMTWLSYRIVVELCVKAAKAAVTQFWDNFSTFVSRTCGEINKNQVGFVLKPNWTVRTT